MNELKFWLAFSKIYSIGTIHFNKMVDYFGSVKTAWNASADDLAEIQGFSSKLIGKFIEERKKLEDLDKLEEDLYKKNINVIKLNDEAYPFLLKQIYDPPIVLYYKGNFERINQDNCLAVVGSRKASHYIKEVLKKIIGGFAGSNISIVSGMAVGVDTCAHQAALDNNLKTIAVLGSGFDNIYPVQNKKLFQSIIENDGVVLSEYYPTERAALWTFPRRNRIISGLSSGTLVAEAGLKSGALITANLCLEQNRELMCIPGMVTNPNTEGIHYLIKNGAGIVTNSEDVYSQLQWKKTELTHKIKNNCEYKFLDNESKIYDILDLEPKSFDSILETTKIGIDELMTALTSLELQGAITQLPGQQFVKNLN